MERLSRLLQVVALSAVATLPVGGYAMAQSLDFSYTFSNGNVLSGVFTGTDAGNDFTVLGVQSVLLNGTDITSDFAGFTLESYDTFARQGSGLNGNGTAVVTLDGTYQDLFFGNLDGLGFAFLVGDNAASVLYHENAAIYAIAQSADTDTNYAQSRWSATIQGAVVPEPASLALVTMGLGVIGYVSRRRTL